MTLYDLDAHFVDWIDPGKREGLDFRCPYCDQRLRIFFANPFDDGKRRGAGPWWRVVSGTSVSDLTLDPSIRWTGHCHVGISNGNVQDAGP